MRCHLPADDKTESNKAASAEAPKRPRQKPDLAPSLGEQFGRTRSSFQRLLSAHVTLLRAEIAEITGQLKTLATLAGVILGLLLTLANMLYIGGFLFVGEWLFGSMGWGLAHGVLFALALMVVLALIVVGGSAGMAALSFVIATVLGIALAVFLGSNVAYDTANYFAPNLPAPLNSAPAVGALAGLVIGALLFALLLARVGGRGGAIGGLVIGAIVGVILGLVIASAPWTWPPAMGFAVTIGLIVWPIVDFVLTWPKLDIGEHFSHLYPKETIETVTETREWLSNQLQSRLPTRGKK